MFAPLVYAYDSNKLYQNVEVSKRFLGEKKINEIQQTRTSERVAYFFNWLEFTKQILPVYSGYN